MREGPGGEGSVLVELAVVPQESQHGRVAVPFLTVTEWKEFVHLALAEPNTKH